VSSSSETLSSSGRSNLALYRKYRSATFAEVIGQEHVTEPLSTALSAGRINHAYLFSGPRGCGKTSSARILARSLNCRQGPTPTPCGVCDSCLELAPNGSGSIDVIEIDAASHGGVEDARDLRERAYYAPARDRYKVYIIDEAHMVTTQGFNALLKLVEEPPEFLVFIFATTEPDKVLQTIRSRTHHYPFRLIPPGVMRAHLERICASEGVTVEPAVFSLVVRAGGGSARDSLSLLDQLLAGAGPGGVTYKSAVDLLGVTDGALIDDMIDALAVGDAASVYGTVDRVVEAGHEPRRFAADLLDRLRDLLILDAVPEAATNGLLNAPEDSVERMAEQALRIGAATAARYAEIVHTALTEMRGTTAPRLVLELVCARMLLPDASADSAALLQRLERLERRAQLTGDAESPAPVSRAAAASPAPTVPPPAAPIGKAQVEGPPAVAAPVVAAPAVAAPSAPEPSPVPGAASVSGALDVMKLRTLWPEVLTAINRSSRTTHALMETAQVAGLSGNEVQLVISTPSLARLLAGPRHTEVIAAALSSLVSGGWTISVGVTGQPGSPPVSGAPAPVAPVQAPPAQPIQASPTPPPTAPPTVSPTVSPVSASTLPASAPTLPVSGPARPAAAPVATDPTPSSNGAWPTVVAVPNADPAPEPKVVAELPTESRPRPPSAQAAPAAQGSGAKASTVKSAARAPSATEAEDPRDQHPDGFDEEPDPDATSARHDPETEALALLQSGLGALPMEPERD
jgi:DNA polymerase-3 subunit gamma/tau